MTNSTLDPLNSGVTIPTYASFPRYFELQAERTPNSIAVEFEGRKVTYRDLNESANRVAHYLIGLDLPTETRIGICLDRSIEAIQA